MDSQRTKIVSMGGCYVDMNVPDFPLPAAGDTSSEELVGGDYELAAGGSAVNVCRRLGATGVFTPIFVGMVGKDAMGDVVAELLEQDGVEARLGQSDTASTAISFNMTSPSAEHLMCVAGTANKELDERAVAMVTEQLEGAEYLFLGGIYKLHAVLPQAAELAKTAREQGVKVVVDHGRVPAGTSDEQKQMVRNTVLAASIYLPSRDELLETWQAETIEDAVAHIAAEAPGLMIAVKDGSRPVLFRSATEHGSVQPPHVEQVVDLTGAGDTFNAYLLAAIARDETLESAVENGCTHASEKVAGTLQETGAV